MLSSDTDLSASGDGAASLCVEYEQGPVSSRQQQVGLLDALEYSEKISEGAEEKDGFSREEKVMTVIKSGVLKFGGYVGPNAKRVWCQLVGTNAAPVRKYAVGIGLSWSEGPVWRRSLSPFSTCPAGALSFGWQ